VRARERVVARELQPAGEAGLDLAPELSAEERLGRGATHVASVDDLRGAAFSRELLPFRLGEDDRRSGCDDRELLLRDLLAGVDASFGWRRRAWTTRDVLRSGEARRVLRPVVFDIAAIGRVHFPKTTQAWLFWAFFASFAIKVPLFPLHTWLPDAHTEAPTAGSVLLAGVLLKMGVYGFLRFSIPLFPDAAHRYAPVLATLGVIGILYGGAIAVVQKDLKRLVAYSSVSHLGFVVLGIAALTPVATTGSVLQMVNHGLSTGALFLLVGMLYDRAHTRRIADFGGLASVVPVYAGIFLFVSLSSLGLPGLNGFIGEFLILNGTFPVLRVMAILGTGGVILAAIYLLWAYERVFQGPTRVPHADRASRWKDLSVRELAAVVPLLIMTVVIGVYPRPFLTRIEPSVRQVIQRASDAGKAPSQVVGTNPASAAGGAP